MAGSRKELSSSRIIAVVALVTALSLLGDSMLYIALPIYWETVGLDSIWQVGLLLSINRFIRLPSNPLVGWVYKNAWVLLRSLWGIAWSFFRIGGLSIVALLADEYHRGRLMGLYNGLYRLGSLVGMLLGGLLVPIIGLDTVSVIFGLATLLGLPFMLFFFKMTESADETERAGTVKKSRTIQEGLGYKIVLISTGFFITMLYQGVFTSTLSSVIEYFYGQKISILDVALSVTLFSGILQGARWIWEPFLGKNFGKWSDGSRGRLPIFIASLIFASITFGFISIDLPLGVWILVIILVMMGATAITTVLDAIAIDTSKTTSVVSFLTLYSIAQDVGAALGPFISYMLIEKENGFTYLYWGGTGIFIILAILWSVVPLLEWKVKRDKGEYIHSKQL
ncbi:MFS transporter [Mesobacillus foraminis]|uniref:MFS transporter n=1 Tax=Mesobacillus foraminis TaxID=279826 RepID=UPI001BE97454|nr:MFS transporter [Mesobacillus foraminis]MBT2756808.1 MFS transporter [Mesobacillus foraminis]